MITRTLLLFFLILFSGCTGMKPELGVTKGRFVPCPETPNCVNSQATDRDHFITPILLDLPVAQAKSSLMETLGQLPEAKIVTEEADYLRVEFVSKLFRFVDDVEFLFIANQETASTIHLRSASRIGYSDLGVNRKRLEDIRANVEKIAENSRPQEN